MFLGYISIILFRFQIYTLLAECRISRMGFEDEFFVFKR